MMKRGFFGFSMGALLSALAPQLDFRVHRLPEGGKVPLRQFKKPFAKEKRQRSSQRGSRDRLILDRSSSVRKLQRYLNNGSIGARDLTTSRSHLHRHGWYQRQMRKRTGGVNEHWNMSFTHVDER